MSEEKKLLDYIITAILLYFAAYTFTSDYVRDPAHAQKALSLAIIFIIGIIVAVVIIWFSAKRFITKLFIELHRIQELYYWTMKSIKDIFNKIKESHGLCIFLLIVLILILSLILRLIFSFLPSMSSPVLINGVADVIAIITLFVLAFGTLIYAGISNALNEKYRLIKTGLIYKELKIIYGALIFCGITLVFVSWFYIQDSKEIVIILLIFLIFFIISLLLIEVGKHTAARQLESNKVNLKMITYDESGKIQLLIKPDLYLYQMTDKDYRFKDLDENEFIVPVGQVQEITYIKPKN